MAVYPVSKIWPVPGPPFMVCITQSSFFTSQEKDKRKAQTQEHIGGWRWKWKDVPDGDKMDYYTD